MPSKIKTNAIAAGSAGFLKPTFSSLRKAVDKNEPTKQQNFWGKDQQKLENELKRKPLLKKSEENYPGVDETPIPVICLPVVSEESPLHSTASTDVKSPAKKENTPSLENNDIKSNDLKPCSLKYDQNFDHENEMKIKDARRVCDELRIQIEELKNQQKAFQSRLSGEFADMNPNNGDKTGKEERSTENDCQNCDVDEEGMKFPDLLKNGTDMSTPVTKHDDKSSSTTEDSFTLHGSVTSSDVTDFVIKDEWLSSNVLPRELPPNKVIKRLLSERERYKKKVKHLQTALHRLKRHKINSMPRTPDIPAHDIMYYNADLIGEGYLSYVYSGTIYKNQKAAVKKLVRPDMMSTSDRSYLAAEAGLLMALHHQNIVEVFGVSTAPLQPLIITELVKGKSLEDRLHKSDGWPLSPVEYYSISRDIAVGMAYLHGQKPPVLHLNLRPCNVLLDANGRAKVSDFGFSKIRLDSGVSNHINLAYLAPELLRFPVHLTTKLDVYSYAIVMWEMATMHIPYKNFKASEILDNVSSSKRMDIPCELPSGFHAILSRSWDHSPMQRPSFKELIILLETMMLPPEWEDAIKRSNLNRTDTNGLVTPRDTAAKSNGALGSGSNSAPLYSKTHFENAKSERRKLSDEIALENDMYNLGYALPKPAEVERKSSDYLRGFKNMRPLHTPSSSVRKSTPSGQQRSLLSRLSPYKYSFINNSPVIAHNHHPTPPMRNFEHSKQEFKEKMPLRFKAARNLNEELGAVQADGGISPLQENDHHQRVASAGSSGYRHSLSTTHKDQYPDRINGLVERCTTGNRSSSETDATSGNGKEPQKTPMPLTGGDMRFHDQNLAVETPKIVNAHGRDHHSRSKDIHSPRSQEDLRMAVSIPYLKNLRSGDEVSSASGEQTNRSQFDEKLNSYVSQACHAESRNYVDSKMKGWRSDRSSILNKKHGAPSSDYIKVRSLQAENADNGGFNDGSRRNASSAISESPETIMTAAYKPDEAKRKELRVSTRGVKTNDIISPTLSDKSLDGTHKIGVVSLPSTSGPNGVPSRPRRVSSRLNHASEPLGPETSPHPHFTPSRALRRENSWNKLKNSYSPEPLLPHFTPFGTPPHSVNIPLPPTLPGTDHFERTSAFTRLDSHPLKFTPKKKEKNRTPKRRETHGIPVPSNGVNHDEVDLGSTSTLSSANDEIGDALEETARELNGVSDILMSAMEKHKTTPNGKKTLKKSRNRE